MNSRIENELGIAIWLATNTNLSPNAISHLCPSIHPFKATILRSGTYKMPDVIPIDPIKEGIFSSDELNKIRLSSDQSRLIGKVMVKRYVPRILRNHIPGVIVWLSKNYPNLPKKNISKALGTTPKRISEVLASSDILPVSPISVQILTESALKELLNAK